MPDTERRMSDYGSDNTTLWKPDREKISDAPERKRLDTSSWKVRRVHDTAKGISYAIYSDDKPVSVKHSFGDFGNSMICLTCHVGDVDAPTRFNSCAHTKYMRKWIEQHPEEAAA